MFIVTGANGFIGSAMVRELNARGHDDIVCVDVVDRKERSETLQKAKFKTFYTTPEFLDWARKPRARSEIRGLFHMGAISSTTETDWQKLEKNNIELSQQMAGFCESWECPYIYASSGAVYGIGELGFNADTRIEDFKPLNLYGRSKQIFDIWMLKQKTPPARWAGLRFFNVYGPNEYHKDAMASVAYKSFLQIKSAGHVQLFRSQNSKYEDGKQLRDFVYVKDITRWMWEIYENKTFANGIYNLGFGQARTWLDLVSGVFKAMNLETKVQWIDMPQALAKQYQYFTEADMKKTFKSGLSAPRFSLEAGVSDYLRNYLLSDDPYL